jgi:hypothetical protein
MRRGGIFILVLVILGTFSGYDKARAQELPSQSADRKGPIIELPETEFDFGNIRVGEKVEHVFTFRNRGDATLVIGKVRSG